MWSPRTAPPRPGLQDAKGATTRSPVPLPSPPALSANVVQDHFATVRPRTVFGNVNALPAPKLKRTISNRNVKRNAGHHGLHMSRHVVGSFHVVNPAGVGWRKAVKRRAEIGADVRIGILLYQERRRGVADEDKHDTVACSAAGDEIPNVFRNLEKPLAARLDNE